MDLLFGYLAGLLTLINPCVLPVLPIVLGTALQASPLGPLALAGGMSLSFVLAGVGVSAFGRAIGLTPEMLAAGGAAVMMAFGAVLLVPRLGARFALATAGLGARADAGVDRIDRGTLAGQALGGILLGAVWVPCVGPTLGGAIALAATGQSLGWAALVMAAFAAGVSTLILVLGYGAQSALRARRDRLRAIAPVARPAMGGIFLLTGAALLFGWFKPVEIWLIETLPFWLQDLSVRF